MDANIAVAARLSSEDDPVAPDGSGSGYGNCYNATTDGELEVNEWEGAGDSGTWRRTWATVASADTDSRGTWKTVGNMGDLYIGTWKGTCIE